jgi:hypothetical protein
MYGHLRINLFFSVYLPLQEKYKGDNIAIYPAYFKTKVLIFCDVFESRHISLLVYTDCQFLG